MTVVMMKPCMYERIAPVPYRTISRVAMEIIASKSMLPVKPSVIRSVMSLILSGPIRLKIVPIIAHAAAAATAGMKDLAYFKSLETAFLRSCGFSPAPLGLGIFQLLL